MKENVKKYPKLIYFILVLCGFVFNQKLLTPN